MLIDMHSHILPGADHGSDSLETSLAQIKKAKEIGIELILATPHYYQHRYHGIDEFVGMREKCYNELMRGLEENGIEMRVMKAAEVTLEVDLANDPDLPKLCIEGTNYILLEMPMNIKWTDWVYNAVYEISAKHHVRPLIAHIDRYEEKSLKKLLEMDVRPQINAAAFCSIFTRRRALKWVREGTVEFLCSDVHTAAAPQYDQFKKALEVIGDRDVARLMDNTADVLGIAEKRSAPVSSSGLIF